MLVVLRAEQPLQLSERLCSLEAIGVRHVEIAWSEHPAWAAQVHDLRHRHPGLLLGAASIRSAQALESVAASGLPYAMAPVLDPALQQQADDLGVHLVPGVFSPSEVHQAMALGCPAVKLFPAASLGMHHWRRLCDPFGALPFCIAAGGLAVADLDPWLAAGVDAVTLGARVADGQALADLQAWIARQQQQGRA